MNIPQNINRRVVLKTFGAGVLGGTMAAGTVSAKSCDADTCISLEGHQFIPRNASVSLGESNAATVMWTNNEPEQFPVPHDVHLENGEAHLVHSSDNAKEHNEYLLPGDSYEVKFYEKDEEADDLVIEEIRDDSSSSVMQTVTIEDWGGSVKLTMRCKIHDGFTNMVGTLTVTE